MPANLDLIDLALLIIDYVYGGVRPCSIEL